jgi:general secretion pathway protein A
LFSAGAVHEIHALSKGFPRLINIICDHALLYGYSANLAGIDGGLIRDCSRDLSVALGMEEAPDDPTPPSAAGSDVRPAAARTAGSPAGGWRSLLFLAAAVLTAGAVVYLLTR